MINRCADWRRVALLLICILSLCRSSLSSEPSQLLSQENEDDLEVTRTVEPQTLSRLESQFLKLFGMARRPQKRAAPLKIPKYLVDLYKVQTGSELGTSNLHLPGRHTRTANTVRTFYQLPSTSSDVRWTFDPVKFDVSSIPEEEEVTGAELRIALRRQVARDLSSSDSVLNSSDNTINSVPDHRLKKSDRVRVLVNDVIQGARDAQGEPIMYPIDSKLVRWTGNDNLQWVTMDVFPAMARWRTQAGKNHGLIIQLVHPQTGEVMQQTPVTPIHVRRRRSVNESGEEDPVLFTYSDDGKNRKQRDATTLSRHYRDATRNVQQRRRKNKNKKRNLCARHKMFVDFTDVGWNDWIVAPPGYHAYHCAGECPFPMADHLNATNHAVIQALVNSMSPALVPPPCCVPTKYSSLSLLYTDSSDKIVLKNYNEMVVDACGCS